MRGVLTGEQIDQAFLVSAHRLDILEAIDLSVDSDVEQRRRLTELDIEIEERIYKEWYALDPDEKIGPSVLHPARMAWVLTNAFENETNNGGIGQFFFNSSGDFALETIVSLRLIGSDELAAILTDAVALFPNAQPSSDRKVRWDELDSVDLKSLEELDNRFFKVETSMYQRMRYAMDHPELFFLAAGTERE